MTEPDPVASTSDTDDTVQLTVPADPAYVSVLRTVTASLAARRDFTIEEIDDLRLAVDEASSLLLLHAPDGSQLTAVFGGSPDNLTVVVSAPAAGENPEIDQTSFAWMVLSALADTVGTAVSDGQLVVSVAKARGARTQ
ncbi:MAG TPA: ATP-binding protein [Jatrophihabitans sp.]